MLSESYYKNIPSRNILKEVPSYQHTTNEFTEITDISLENMLINSNLANSSIIK